MENLGKFVSIVVLLSLSTIITGFTLSVLWGWFITPTFNVMELTIIQAIGISFTKNYMFFKAFKKQKSDNEKFKFKEFTVGFVNTIGLAVISLGFGYIYHLFM